MSHFTLGSNSLREAGGVHPHLIQMVKYAIYITPQDFALHDGLRTLAEQREYVRTGASQTMDSLHLPQRDGWGHAVDLVPYINGKLRWEWPAIYPIAESMRAAAVHYGYPLEWGGIKGFGSILTLKGPIKSHTGWDGPHFQLPRSRYP